MAPHFGHRWAISSRSALLTWRTHTVNSKFGPPDADRLGRRWMLPTEGIQAMVSDLGRVSRRAFLYGSAVVAGSATLSACSSSSGGGGGGTAGTDRGQNTGKGSATRPLAAPSTFTEAPALAAQAKSGKLPKLSDRLPATPYVIPHNWASRGKYGGALRMVVFSTTVPSAAIPIGSSSTAIRCCVISTTARTSVRASYRAGRPTPTLRSGHSISARA